MQELQSDENPHPFKKTGTATRNSTSKITGRCQFCNEPRHEYNQIRFLNDTHTSDSLDKLWPDNLCITYMCVQCYEEITVKKLDPKPYWLRWQFNQ